MSRPERNWLFGIDIMVLESRIIMSTQRW